MTETDAFAGSCQAIRDTILSSFGVPRHVLLGELPPMTPEQAFMQAICEHPDDDTPRLVFADYLEEHGQSERAEFIRVQCKLPKTLRNPARHLELDPADGRWKESDEDCGGCPRCDLRRREKELLGRTKELKEYQVRDPEYGWLPENVRYLFETGPRHGRHNRFWEWRRGFISEITLSCEDWLQHREALLKVAPLKWVTLTHIPHFSPQDTYTLRRGQSLYINNEVGDVIDLSFPASNLTTLSR